MKNFTDGTNQWSIEITIGTIKRVLATTGINLLEPHQADDDGQSLADRLIHDTILQVDVIFALLEPQARAVIHLTEKERSGTDVEQREARIQKFCELFKPEVMQAAETAFLEEWTDFFLKLGREGISKAITQTRTLQQTMRSEGIKQLERLQDAQAGVMTKALTDQVDKLLQLAEDAMKGETSESAIGSPVALELQALST